MSTPTVQCPKCFTRVPDAADQTGAVVCSGCESQFTPDRGGPPRKSPPLPVARAVPVGGKPADPAKAPAAPVAKPARSRDADADRPRSRSDGAKAGDRRRREEDDEDDRPRSSRRRRYEDDDEPKKKTKGSALPLILIGGGALLLMTLGGAAAIAIAVFGSQPVAQGTSPVYTPATVPVKPDDPARPRGNWDDPEPFLDPKKPEEPRRPNPRLPGDFPGGPGPGPGLDPFPVEPPKPKEPKAPPKYADITPLPIKPAKLTEETVELKLPGKVGDTCSGGGGRFFIAHLSDKRQLAVFDVNEAKVVKYIPLASDTVKFAAGMNKLVVAYPDQNTFTRFDLTTFEKDVTAKSPLDGTVRHLCMGSASAGPMLVSYTKGGGALDSAPLTFLDPTTFKEVDVSQPQNRVGSASVRDAMHFRASPDGTLFGAWCTSHSPQGLNSIVIKGESAKGHYEHDSVGHVVPGPDGTLYTGRGKYTGELKKLGKDQNAGNVLLPAAEGHMYVRLTSGGEGGAPFPGGMPGDGQKMKLEVKMIGDERTVHTFKNVSLTGNEAWTSADFTNDKRVHFAPSAHLLVVVPNTNDKLVLHKFDLEAAFEASGVDYLYVASRPPTAVPGKAYEYQIGTRSKKGGVKHKLDAGPDGLKVSDAGKVTWATPHDFKGPEQVIITVSDSSGQEVFHTFELVPGDGKGFAGPIVGAAKVPAAKADDKPDPKAAQGLVPAPDRVFEIKPPMVQEKTAVALPGPADGVCVGGGGRFLVYRLGTKKQLAVLDVTLGKVVKYLPLAESDALFAANTTKLFVYYKTAAALIRYDLEKFEKELTAQNPLGGSPSLMLMGHSSDGPLYLGGPDVGTDTKGYGFINTRTMKELKVPLEGRQAPDGVPGQVLGGPAVGGDRFRGGGGAVGVAVSPDGRTYCWSDDWGGNKVMTLADKAGKVKGDGIGGGQNRGALLPGPDGHLFGTAGVFTADLKKLGDAKTNQQGGTFAPATSGSWYVGITTDGDRFDPSRMKRKVSVGLTADERVKFPFDALDGLPATQDPWSPQAATKVPMAARLHLVPQAEILAVLDDGMEKVHLHRVPLKALLEKTDGDYMMVVSRPPPAVRGQKWAYTPDVWSKKGGVKVKVESGPDGMKATGGSVAWDVPAKPADDEPTVILTVSDASGQESFHTFTLSVRGEGLPAVTVIKPAPPAVDPVKAVDPTLPKPKAPVAFPLKPTAAKDGTDVDLPGTADYACAAGGGRFLLFRIPSKKLVAVFDVVDGKVVKELAMPEEGALVAGSRSFAYVVNPKAGLVQRWNLSTFEKEATTKLPEGFAPQVAVVGHASEGPMFLGGGGERFGPGAATSGFYDPLTLKRIDLKKAADAMVVGDVKPGPSPPEAGSVFCSPDGRVWAWWNKGSSPTGLRSLVIDGDSARGASSHVSVGPIVVGPDGSLFTGAGVFAGDQSKVIEATVKGVKVRAVNSWREINIENGGYYQSLARTPIPATDGPFYLWYPAEKADPGVPRPQPKPTDPPPAEVPPVLKLVGVPDSLGEVKGLRGMAELKEDPTRPRVQPGHPQADRSLLAHQRTFLVPGAELLAVLSPDGTKIHIHAFKARELIDKSGQEYLLVMGRPPQFAPRGQKWAYTPDVWTKKGGVKVEVVSGPPGLKAVGAGVEWAVPADLLDNLVTVELRVSDASGRKVTERFALSLDGSAPTPPVQTSEGGGTGKDDPKKGVGMKGKVDDALVGTWVVDKYEFDTDFDVPIPPESKNARFVFEKDGTMTWTAVFVGRSIAGTFETDATASPKTIDFSTSHIGQQETTFGLYEVDGDTLRISTGHTPVTGRPKAVKVDRGKAFVIVLKRVKGGAKPPVKADPPKKEGPTADDPKGGGKKIVKGQIDDALVGTWQMSAVHSGSSSTTIKQGPTETNTRFEFRKDGTTHAGTVAKAHLAPGTFTTDPTGNPKALDLVSTQGGGAFAFLMVYEVTGDVLTICRGEESDSPRPTALTAQKGVRRITLTRVKDEPKKDAPGGSIPPVKAEPPKEPTTSRKPIELKGNDKDESLVGTWEIEKYEVGGRGGPLNPGFVGVRYIFDKDGTARLTGGPEEQTGTYVLDVSATPKAIDIKLKSKSVPERKEFAIYDVKDDVLLLAKWPVQGSARPTDFNGIATPVLTLKRVKDEPKKDEKGKLDDALLGSWLVTKLELNGGELPSNVSKQTYTFGKDGTGRLTGGPQDANVKYTVDAAATPKAIDLTISASGLPDSDQRGVYEVTGDTLRLCTALVKGAERPKAMKSGDKVLLLTLTRVKDAPVKPEPPKDPKATPPKAADPAKRDDKDEALAGTWAISKREFRGSALPLVMPFDGIRHTFDKDGGVRVTGGPGGDELTGTYKLDTSVSPKAIDMTLKSKSGAEQKVTGVYEATGDTVLLSLPPVPGGARPTDLKGTGVAAVMTLKRVEEPKKDGRK